MIMPRPKLSRRLCIRPEVTYYKPRGVPLRHLQHVHITREELEVLWLVDEKGQNQNQAAKHMHTSQSTVQRVLTVARKKVAHAIVQGKAIAIENND
jgi:predicted DNA-binding protein (UPF0251 family)